MVVIVELGSPYSEIAQLEEMEFNIKNDMTIKEFIKDYFLSNSKIYRQFKHNNLLNSKNELKCIFVVNKKLVIDNYMINQDIRIKLLYPICGG